ncbi:ankyrin repeat-containing domain protein [Baffinella frigidus]|nr:ankyrin repeat-containing domain protein [Cryptophyta sp. CCMP2293]
MLARYATAHFPRSWAAAPMLGGISAKLVTAAAGVGGISRQRGMKLSAGADGEPRTPAERMVVCRRSLEALKRSDLQTIIRSAKHWSHVDATLGGSKVELINRLQAVCCLQGGATPLHFVAINGQEAVALTLVEAGAHLEALDEAVALTLVDAGAHLEALDEAGAYLDARDEVVALALVEAGAHLEALGELGQTPLHKAAFFGNAGVARVLVDAGADTEASDVYENETPLHYASYFGHVAVVKVLIAAGAELEAARKHGWTALHFAAINGHPEVARALLVAGANAQAADEKQQTPLHKAALFTHEEGGATALHAAAWIGDEAAARVLVRGGADLAAQDKVGQTPLHIAAYYGFEEVARALVEAHAALETTDQRGKTALQLAQEKRWESDPAGRDAVAAMLIQAGAVDKTGGTGVVLHEKAVPPRSAWGLRWPLGSWE